MNGDAVVAATGGEDPAGLAAAYDRYAAELYDYCRWLQPDQALVAGALRETFATLAASPPAPAGTGELRSWLYATARKACRRPAPPVRDGIGAPAPGTPDPELAEARWLTRAALGELDPVEQEVIELRFRHHLTATESAAVLRVPADRIPDLAESGRHYLQDVLGALVVVRAGSSACPQLAALLASRDGPVTVSTGKLAARHISHCRECARHHPGELRPERLPDLLPLATPPGGLREVVLPRPAQGPGPDEPDGRARPRGFRRVRALLTGHGVRADPTPTGSR